MKPNYSQTAIDYEKGMQYLDRLGISRLEAERNLKGLERLVIKIGGDCLNGNNTNLIEHIAVLNQLGIYPVVTHGGQTQINVLMERYGIQIERIGQQRVTDKRTLDLCVIPALRQVNEQLVGAIIDKGGRTVTLADHEIIYVTQLNKALGYVGQPVGINSQPIVKLLEMKCSPVLWCIGYDQYHQAYNVNGDRIPQPIIKAIGAQKLISVTKEGGVFGSDGSTLIPTIGLSKIDCLIEGGIVKKGMIEKLQQAEKVLRDQSLGLADDFKVQLIRPDQLLTELATNKGAGTEIVKD
ncbi:MAG: acetylglutamate kinase [Nanoarchaeota archaeon]